MNTQPPRFVTASVYAFVLAIKHLFNLLKPKIYVGVDDS